MHKHIHTAIQTRQQASVMERIDTHTVKIFHGRHATGQWLTVIGPDSLGTDHDPDIGQSQQLDVCLNRVIFNQS